MKNKILLAIMAVALVFAFTSCNNGSTGKGPQEKQRLTDTYTGVTADGDTYTLKITQKAALFAILKNDTYELTVGLKKSAGIVDKADGNVLTLKPDGATVPFTVTITTGGGITKIESTITWSDGSTSTVGTLTPGSANTDPKTIIIEGYNLAGKTPRNAVPICRNRVNLLSTV
jgi:hypothetical protein